MFQELSNLTSSPHPCSFFIQFSVFCCCFIPVYVVFVKTNRACIRRNARLQPHTAPPLNYSPVLEKDLHPLYRSIKVWLWPKISETKWGQSLRGCWAGNWLVIMTYLSAACVFLGQPIHGSKKEWTSHPKFVTVSLLRHVESPANIAAEEFATKRGLSLFIPVEMKHLFIFAANHTK